MNNQEDSGLKSSKPETSEDSLNKNKQTENDNNDHIIQINKDSFDDDCKIHFVNFFLIKNSINKQNKIKVLYFYLFF